jgi:hypothetical protein
MESVHRVTTSRTVRKIPDRETPCQRQLPRGVSTPELIGRFSQIVNFVNRTNQPPARQRSTIVVRHVQAQTNRKAAFDCAVRQHILQRDLE